MQKRKHIRLRNYDYSSCGLYFITIAIRNKKCLFGKIENVEMQYTELGKIALLNWQEIPNHYKQIKLHDYVVMPNHIHGILEILPQENEKEKECNAFSKTVKGSISSIIGKYKASVTRWCNKNGYSHFKWQERFYDHVIQNEKSYDFISDYIITNPQNWKKDIFYYKQ